VTALLGPRQSGKTTLSRQAARGQASHYFDLENPADDARLQNPRTALEGLRGLVILDEVPLRPDIFGVLRGLADRRPRRSRFLLLGSASPDLVRGASESLAGRIHFVDMGGFTLDEVGPGAQQKLWLRGGFPGSFLARAESQSLQWRDDFIRTFLERDIPRLGIRIPAGKLRRFWSMLAHYHGQVWNASEIAASLGLAHTTTRDYLDLLSGAFMVRQLAPWHENMGKRVVKAPKIYIRDSGLFHSLMRFSLWRDLQAHPKLGASWEGFAIEQILKIVGERDVYFWATHAGAELDLFVPRGSRRWGFEFKVSETPRLTKSIHVVLKDLRLSHLWIVYPGDHSFPLSERVTAIGLKQIPGLRLG
jgi:predicted AAA+ superfamily ATPase